MFRFTTYLTHHVSGHLTTDDSAPMLPCAAVLSRPKSARIIPASHPQRRTVIFNVLTGHFRDKSELQYQQLFQGVV